MKRVKFLVLTMLVVCVHITQNTYAGDYKKTPYGAEFDGNDDGSIPSWQGGEENKEKFGEGLLEEKPLYIINSSNMDQYRSILPRALSSLIEQYPETMEVPVFTSYRPAYYHNWIYDAIRKNRESVKLIKDGSAVIGAYPGIPFPDPKNGYEVLWNHMLSFRGVSLNAKSWEIVVQENRRSSIIKSRVKLSSEYYNKDRDKSKEDQIHTYYLSTVISPPKLSGSSLLVHERVNGSIIPRQAWGYLAGQRRVVRIPSIDYDAPMPRSEGIRFADEVDVYIGSIDRYQWRLLGKKEMIIPYNNKKLYDELQISDGPNEVILTKSHMNPEVLRYEKHRVWVVEGLLKKEKSHPYKKRILYLDEDSWNAVLAENYNRKGDLWRVSASYVKLYHAFPGIFKVVDVHHDLKDKAYYAQGALGNEGNVFTVGDTVLPKRGFKPSALRRLGRR